jgi:hypothetical protein
MQRMSFVNMNGSWRLQSFDHSSHSMWADWARRYLDEGVDLDVLKGWSAELVGALLCLYVSRETSALPDACLLASGVSGCDVWELLGYKVGPSIRGCFT